MNNDWIDRLNAPADSRATHDAMERAAQYQGVAGPRWNGIKIELKASVESYNRKPETRKHVEVEDAGHRLMLRGRDHALDITFYQDKARIIGAYHSHKQRQGRKFIALGLDMRDDGLVVIDRRGCPVDDPARLLLEPFFRCLRDAERPTWWESSRPAFPR